MKTVNTFDFGTVANGARKSPVMSTLTDGQIYVLERGVDFTAKYMAAQIRKYVQTKMKCDWHETPKFVRIAGGKPEDAQCVVQFAVNGEFTTPKATKAPEKTTRSQRRAAAKSK